MNDVQPVPVSVPYKWVPGTGWIARCDCGAIQYVSYLFVPPAGFVHLHYVTKVTGD